MNETILVIEDDFLVQKKIHDILTLSKYNVLAEESGRTGWEAVLREKPDLILCDLAIPDWDGFQVLSEVKKEKSTRDIPFVILSANVELQTIRKGMNLGADDYVTKPFDLEEFLTAISVNLEKCACRKESKTERQWEALARHQEALVSLLAHDMKNAFLGIASICNFVEKEAIQKKVALGDSITDAIGYVKSASEKNMRYLEDLLDDRILRAGIFSENKKTFLVRDSILDCLQKFIWRAKQKRIEIVCNIPEDLSVHCQETTLCTILTNLVSNAIKFSHPGSRVQIDAKIRADRLLVTVVDFGIGMDSKLLDRLLEERHRTSNSGTLGEKGSGLGIILAQSILENMGGKLEFQSSPGNGTTALMYLPLN